jgi:hypothetical protein
VVDPVTADDQVMHPAAVEIEAVLRKIPDLEAFDADVANLGSEVPGFGASPGAVHHGLSALLRTEGDPGARTAAS